MISFSLLGQRYNLHNNLANLFFQFYFFNFCFFAVVFLPTVDNSAHILVDFILYVYKHFQLLHL